MNTTPPVAQNSNTSSTLFECRDDSGEYDTIHKYVLIIGSSVVLIFGTGGNLVTYKVFKQKGYRHNVMASMFRYLSVLDSIFLWTTVLQLFIKGLTGYHVRNKIGVGCLLDAVCAQILMSLANWLLVVITSARLVHIKCPLKSQTICSRLNYNLLLVATHFFVIVVHGASIINIYSRLSEADLQSGGTCYYHITREDVDIKAQKLVYIIVNFLGPAFLLIIFNSLIICELRAEQIRKQHPLNRATIASNKYTPELTTGFSEEATSRDQTNNAVESDKPPNRPQNEFCTFKCKTHNESNCGELAKQEHGTNGNGKDTSTDFPAGATLNTQKCLLIANETTHRHRQDLAHKGDTSSNPTTANDRVKLRLFTVDTFENCNYPSVFDEIEVAEKVPERAALSNAVLSRRHDILRDSTWSNSGVPAPVGQAVGQASSADPTTARSDRRRPNIEDRYLGASLEVSSEVISQSSRSQPSSGDKRLSMRSWFSDARSHGVDMDSEDGGEPNLDVGDKCDAVIPYEGRDTKQHSRAYTLTRMLITASAVFLLLNTPFWILRLGFVESFSHPSVSCSFRYMVADLLLLVRYSNNSLNFIFYCAVGNRFRRDFFLWFRNLRA